MLQVLRVLPVHHEIEGSGTESKDLLDYQTELVNFLLIILVLTAPLYTLRFLLRAQQGQVFRWWWL